MSKFYALIVFMALNVSLMSADVYTRKDGTKLTLLNMCKGVLSNAGHIEKLAEKLDEGEEIYLSDPYYHNSKRVFDVEVVISNTDSTVIFTLNIKGNIDERFYLEGNNIFAIRDDMSIYYFYEVRRWFYDEYKNTDYYFDILRVNLMYVMNYQTKNGYIQLQGFPSKSSNWGVTVPVFFVSCKSYEGKDSTSVLYGIDKMLPHYDKVSATWNVAYLVAYVFGDYKYLFDIPVPHGLDASFKKDYETLKAAVKTKNHKETIKYIKTLNVKTSSVMQENERDELILFMIQNKLDIKEFDIFKKEKKFYFSRNAVALLCKTPDLLDAFFITPLCGGDKYNQFGEDYTRIFAQNMIEARNQKTMDVLIENGVFSHEDDVAIQICSALKNKDFISVQNIIKQNNKNFKQIAQRCILSEQKTVLETILDTNNSSLIEQVLCNEEIELEIISVTFDNICSFDGDNISILFMLPEYKNKTLIFLPHLETLTCPNETNCYNFNLYSQAIWEDVHIDLSWENALPPSKIKNRICRLYRDDIFDSIYDFASNFETKKDSVSSDSFNNFYSSNNVYYSNVPMRLDDGELIFDTSVTNTAGETLLMRAIRRGNIDFCKELLKKGVCVNAKNNDGQTAQDIATVQANKKIISLLKKYTKNK